ncbi:MAG: nitroreductase [Comamonadaceae bacterium]|nr:nitroreductase [Comamonadaceae bacterium]
MDAGTDDAQRFLIEQACKAPSGHNSQPWLFEPGAQQIRIHPDLRQALPVVDPERRELFISLGCAAENLCLAASTRGLRTAQTLSPQGVITIALTPDPSLPPDPLAAAIDARQTNRSRYDGTPVGEELLHGILEQGCAEPGIALQAWPQGSAPFERLSDYVQQGNAIQMRDAAFKHELLQWIRFNAAQASRTRNGISHAALGAPSLPAWIARPIVRHALDPVRQNRSDAQRLRSASHLILVGSAEDGIPAWVATGRSLQRLLLRLSRAGIAHSYLNPPCEVPVLRQRLAAEPWVQAQPQILLRIGHAQRLPASWRKPIGAVLYKAA